MPPAPDGYATPAGVKLTVDAANGDLANDLANEGGARSAVLVSAPSVGTLSLSPNDAFVYKPIPGKAYTTMFTYRAKNNHGKSSITVVTITAG